jgi:hypothetical protein
VPKKKQKQDERTEVVRTLAYFAEDGNYGSADGLTIMETTHWDNIDWSIIEGARDEFRPMVARLITESYEPDANEEVLRAEFEKYGVDISDYEKQ